MRIKSIRIQNFRSFEDETVVFNDYTCLVGPNGSGKSTVLVALNIFFRETAGSPLNLLELQAEDFHSGNTSEPVTITVTFYDLGGQAQEDFADYFRQGQLVVTAVAKFDPDSRRAPVLQYGQRTGIAAFGKFFRADKEKASVDALKAVYTQLRSEYAELPPPATKQKMIDALRAFEESRPDLTELIPSEDQFYGFSKGANRLARHLQWVFVPAVKDASTEQDEGKDTALGKLLARTVRARISFAEELRQIRTQTQGRYQEMLDRHQAILDEISVSLKARLAEWAHPDARLAVQWQQDPEKSVRVDDPFARIVAGEGPFSGNLARFGHGFQRAYLLALLQELSRTTGEVEPTLILAIEEPELYQHPPQCRHMAKVLRDVASSNSQVVVTTHSLLFVSGETFKAVRMVRKEASRSEASVSYVPLDRLSQILAAARDEDVPKGPEGILAKIHQALQPSLNEIFFAPHLVLVEGREDIAYILTYMTLLGRTDDLRRVGCHLVAADRKSSLLIPFAIVKELRIPTFLVFDADTHAPDRNGNREMHRKNNLALLRLAGVTKPDPLPAATFWGDSVVMWCTEFSREVEADFAPEEWRTLCEEIESRFGHIGNLKKNPLFISDLLEGAWTRGLRSAKLGQLCDRILKFCGIA